MALVGSLLNLTVGAGLGTAPSALAQAAVSDDIAGQITVSSGTATAAGVLFTFNLGTSYSDIYGRQNPIIVVSPANAATAGLGLYVTCANGNLVTVGCAVAPAATTALAVNYQITT